MISITATQPSSGHRESISGQVRLPTADWNAWRKRMDQDSYHRQISYVASNLELSEQSHATAFRLGNIVKYLESVLSLPETSSDSRRKNAYEKIRDWIIDMQILTITPEDLAETQVVTHLRIFLSQKSTELQTQDNQQKWIEEELTVLMRKWDRGDLSGHPNRGFQRDTGNRQGMEGHHRARMANRLCKEWSHYLRADFFGEGHLVNGQTWYSRLELMRDGVHASRFGGIAGAQDEGAYSIVMSYHEAGSKDRYPNVDNGEVIEYMGTSLKDAYGDDAEGASASPVPSTTACTATMKRSLRTKIPVRVVRKFKIGRDGIHGYRYDGLYTVVAETLKSAAKQEWRFTLVGKPGQGPLRTLSIDPTHMAQHHQTRH